MTPKEADCEHRWVPGGLKSDWVCDDCGERCDMDCELGHPAMDHGIDTSQVGPPPPGEPQDCAEWVQGVYDQMVRRGQGNDPLVQEPGPGKGR
jgi:hypothetical protein